MKMNAQQNTTENLKIVDIKRNDDNLIYPVISLSNGKEILIKVNVLTDYFKTHEILNIKLPIEIDNKKLFESYKKAYSKEIEKIVLWVKGEKKNYNKLPLFLKGLYSELLSLNLLEGLN